MQPYARKDYNSRQNNSFSSTITSYTFLAAILFYIIMMGFTNRPPPEGFPPRIGAPRRSAPSKIFYWAENCPLTVFFWAENCPPAEKKEAEKCPLVRIDDPEKCPLNKEISRRVKSIYRASITMTKMPVTFLLIWLESERNFKNNIQVIKGIKRQKIPASAWTSPY